MLLSSFLLTVYSQNPAAGLVGYYTFCDCTARDGSGNNNHGVVFGAPQCIRGVKDYGLLTNQNPGTNGCGQLGGQYIQLPTFGPIWADGFTVCAWIRFDQNTYFERIVDLGNTNGEAGGLNVWFGREGNSNNLALESWINSDPNQARNTGRLTAVNAITNGNIEYYCATIHEDTMRIYVNGILKAEKRGNPILNVTRTNNFIGHSNWCFNDPDFKGFVDEVRIYNRALNAVEVQNIYLLTNINDFTVNTVCNSLDVGFSAPNAVSIDSLRWDFGDPATGVQNGAAGFTASHTFSAPGNYSVRLIAYKPCLNDTVTKTVSVHQVNTGFLGPDFSVCPGTPGLLKMPVPGATYLWQDGSTADSLLVNDAGSYWLQVSAGSCTYRDTVNVTSLQKTFSESLSICEGQTYSGYGISGTYVDTFPLPNGCDSIRTLLLNVITPITTTIDKTICRGDSYLGYTSSGIYYDTLRSVLGCDSLIQILRLTVVDAAVVTVNKSNDINCILGTSKLSATGGVRYAWTPAATLSNPSVPDPVASPVMSTIYYVQVTTAGGCTVTDSILVEVTNGPADNGFPVPSAFTPNGDGKNDSFGVPFWGSVENFSFSVYNRWGGLVFNTKDNSECWDGRIQGINADSGAYVYIIQAQTRCGPVQRKGTVFLIR